MQYNINFRHAYNCAKELFDKLIADEKKKFVLYPNGEITRFVKDFLKENYEVEADYVIDNKRFDGKYVLSMEQAKARNNEDVSFIICSDNAKYYEEIREVIYNCFDKNKIYDMFPEEINYKALPDDKQICEILMELEQYVREKETVCL